MLLSSKIFSLVTQVSRPSSHHPRPTSHQPRDDDLELAIALSLAQEARDHEVFFIFQTFKVHNGKTRHVRFALLINTSLLYFITSTYCLGKKTVKLYYFILR